MNTLFTSTDEQLVLKALKGDKKAWFSLLSRYEKSVFNYAVRMTGNSHDGSDLMQEIFVSVFNSLDSYHGTGAFRSWLFRIAHFRCMDFSRRKKPDVGLDEVPNIEQIPELTTGSTPETSMQDKQSQRQVRALMQSLSVNQRLVVELKFFSQFTFEEIAQQLDVSSNTVKSRLYAALANLKDEALKYSMEVDHA
jgi:RNA polymerase sigma-70 factor (ECF subfamily)